MRRPVTRSPRADTDAGNRVAAERSSRASTIQSEVSSGLASAGWRVVVAMREQVANAGRNTVPRAPTAGWPLRFVRAPTHRQEHARIRVLAVRALPDGSVVSALPTPAGDELPRP